MTAGPVRYLLLLTGLLLWLPAAPAAPARFEAEVTQVKDGDSVVLRSDRVQYEARLGEVDAPEYKQPWGNAARRALDRLVQGKRVAVMVQDIDAYGRLVVRLVHQGVDINRRLVAEGHAWAYRDYLRDRELLALEAAARREGLGLWSQPGPVAPWLYRRGERRATPIEHDWLLWLTGISAKLRGVTAGFSCGAKTYCSQMKSCGEAQFYLRHCGVSTLDGDGDGKPCERGACSRR